MSHTAIIEIAAAASTAKAAVGPVAWLVLEHLALSARGEANTLVAEETARSVAAAVSVSKDTAAGALRRLADAGFVERRPQDRAGGRFGSAGYVLHLPPGLATTVRGEAATPPRPRPARPPRPQRHDQLTLLDHPQDPQP